MVCVFHETLRGRTFERTEWRQLQLALGVDKCVWTVKSVCFGVSSAPTFDYGDMPSPLSETESTITVLLRPAQGRGAPVRSGDRRKHTHQVTFYSKRSLLKVHPRVSSTYQVVVEEETGKKVKRELGLQECFPLPMSHGEAQARGTPHYYTAELPPSSLPEASPFTVGDNHTYNGYWNSPLDPRKSYLVYFQAMSNFRGVSDCKLRSVV